MRIIVIILVVLLIAVGALYDLARPRGCAATQTAAAASCKAYAEAQEIFHRTDYDGDGVLEYAQFLTGNDSLLEQTAGSGNLALIDRTFGSADMSFRNPKTKAGYFFKILTSQGPAAHGGAKTFIDSDGNMTGGYALAACPSVHGSTGTDTFIINQDGTIYQKNLGPDSLTIVRQMTEFNPDSTWAQSE